MIRMTLLRLAQAVPVLFAVSLIAFALLRTAPGDPAITLAGVGASQEQVDAIRHELHLDRSLPEQYVLWLQEALSGDLGDSYTTRQPVTELLADRFPATVQLALTALVLVIVIAVPLGVLAALRRGGAADHLVRILSLGGLAVPSFVLGMGFVLLFGWYVTGVWPYQGFVAYGTDPVEAFRHLLLPALALAFPQIGVVARTTRSGMLDVLSQEYITAARAFGVPERRVVAADALRNALLPVVTQLGVVTGLLLGGSVIVENVFGINGMGSLLVASFGERNYSVTVGVMLVIALVFVLVNLAVDLLYGAIDPRIRAGYRKGEA
ncbi:ABC transporter permease [Yinghuangia soli]|uniref:ABC transporter permease n=1 Tax=Yinghuangia soli TaxID=2908204 RepID=A0AA41Q4P2_9ACTN|nr:ABC transporter permease [Yinghuangia soli]MCF2531505.1 ABC transporter permease [Yinghuangia soli]